MKESLYSEQWFQKKLERAAARKQFRKDVWESFFPAVPIVLVAATIMVGLAYLVDGVVKAHSHDKEITTLKDRVQRLEDERVERVVPYHPTMSWIIVTNNVVRSFSSP